MNLIKRYKGTSEPLKASLWFMICSVINKGIAFLTTPLFTRMLTQEEYGVVNLYSTWVVLLTIVITLSLATGVYNKAMIKYENDKDGYTSSSLSLITLLVTTFFLLYILFQDVLQELIDLPKTIMVMMFIEILATTTWDLYSIRNRFEYKYKSIVIITITVNVIATLLSLYFVSIFPENRAEARIFGLVVIHTIAYSFLYLKMMIKGKTIFNKEYWLYSAKYNLPLIPHYLSQQILNQSDRIMIGRMCGMRDAGIYSLAYQVAAAMQIVTNAVHVTFMPWCFKCLKNQKGEQIGKRALQIELLIGVICLVFSLFAPEVVLLLGGESYYSAIYIIPPASISIVFLTMYSFFGNIELYFEETKIVMVASLIVAILNIILNWILIGIFGFVAAGYTTLFCYMLYSAIHYHFMKEICKKNNIDNPFNGRQMWMLAGGLAVVSIGVSVIYQYTVIRLISAFVLLFVVGLYTIRNKDFLLYGKSN